MSDPSGSYPRREFLTRCAAAPLAAGLLAAAEPVLGEATSTLPPFTRDVPRMSEAELVRQVERLLVEVPSRARYQYVPLEPSKNAWPQWEAFAKKFVEMPADDPFYEGFEQLCADPARVSDEMRQRITDWVAQNRDCLRQIDAVLRVGQIEFPRAQRSVRLALSDQFGTARSMARLKRADSALRLFAGDVAGALAAAIDIVALGNMLLDAEVLLVDLLVATAILGVAADGLQSAALSPRATLTQAKAVIDALARSKPPIDHLKRACRIELCRWSFPTVASFPERGTLAEYVKYHLAADLTPDTTLSDKALAAYRTVYQQICQVLADHPRPFDKAATVRLLGELTAQWLDELDKPWSQRRHDLLAPVQRSLAAWPSELGSSSIWFVDFSDDAAPKPLSAAEIQTARDALRVVDNPFGKFLVLETLGAVLICPILEMQQARVEAARLKIGLTWYEKERDKLPESLGELVNAGLLPAVPSDPYDGQPYRYSRERRVIWSINQDGQNMGEIPEVVDPEFPFDENFELTWRVTPAATNQ